MDFTALFVDVDDFWQAFGPGYEKQLLSEGTKRRRRQGQLSTSEIMTILIAYQDSRYRSFEYFYFYLQAHHRDAFPGLVSYNRFVELIPRATMPLFAYLINRCLGTITGTSFVDSTPLSVCKNKRINRHRTFEGIAKRGKSTMGYFFGFKLHLIINECGELLAFNLTPGNVDDRQPVPTMANKLWGKLFGDKGYISQKLFNQLYDQGLKLITPIRNNMKNKMMEWEEKLLLRKRSLIETVNDQLKNICDIEHSRHRSPAHFLTHLIAGLIAYTKKPKHPTIRTNPSIPQPQPALA